MKKLKKRWYEITTLLGCAILAFILLFFCFYPTVYPYFIKPTGREWIFLEGFSEDYTGYVSYIKHSMSGKNYVVVRSVPNKLQTPTPIHFLYILIGKIGKIFRLSAPVAYHVSRAMIGLTFVFVVFYFYVFLIRDKIKALLLTIVSFVSLNFGWFTFEKGQFIYQTLGYWPYSFDITKRVASRPHYEFGAIIFLLVFLFIFYSSMRLKFRGIIINILSLLLSLVHVPFAIVLLMTESLLLLLGVISKKISVKYFFLLLWSMLGLIIGLLISYWASKQPPWNLVYVNKGKQTTDSVWQQIVFFGPTFWLGISGLILNAVKKKNLVDVFVLLWVLVQFSFFFFFYRFINADPTRFIQSLYFIPLVYGVSFLFKRKLFYLAAVFLIILAIPTFIHDFQKNLVFKKDKQESFSAFLFPSENMMKAYDYLDKNTPYESTVLAGYEAANNILMYSHNFTIGNNQGWTEEKAKKMSEERNTLFMGYLTDEKIQEFLRKYKIEYIYGGYQERLSNIFERRKDLFDSVYQNSEVVIYKVKH